MINSHRLNLLLATLLGVAIFTHDLTLVLALLAVLALFLAEVWND